MARSKKEVVAWIKGAIAALESLESTVGSATNEDLKLMIKHLQFQLSMEENK